MTDYGQLYNERYSKDAPRYSNNSQARTYQDYMRNIQMQRQNIGQTFGNLAQQQANQSFYNRAMGQPQGLSGGMEQQYANVTNAQRAQQLGQISQQRFQAFGDLAAQEAQASQFARAQAIQEQQFQAQEFQLGQQKFAAAQQIMDAPNLTRDQKVEQLKSLGMTEGEISRMNAPTAAPVVGAGVTSAAVYAGTGLYNRYQNVKLAQGLVEEGLTEAAKRNQRITTLVSKRSEALSLAQKELAELPRNATAEAKQAAQKKIADATTDLERAKKFKIKNLKDLRKNLIDDIANPASKVGKEFAEDASFRTTKKIISKKAQQRAAGKISNILKKAPAGKSAFKTAFGKIGGVVMPGLSIIFTVDMGLQLLTGQGIVGNVKSLLEEGTFAEGGAIGLLSNR